MVEPPVSTAAAPRPRRWQAGSGLLLLGGLLLLAWRLGSVHTVPGEVLTPARWQEHQLLNRAVAESQALHSDWLTLRQLYDTPAAGALAAVQRQAQLQRIHTRHASCSAPTAPACAALQAAVTALRVTRGLSAGPDPRAAALEQARRAINALIAAP